MIKPLWLKNLFLKDKQLKILSFLIAMLSFYAIREATSFEVVYDFPLEIKVEKGIAILDQDTKTVHLTFRGSREDIRLLDQNSIKVVVRPKATDPRGSETIDIRNRNVSGISSVRVIKIIPSTVTLTFDREAEKIVPIEKPVIIGSPFMGKAEIEYEPRFATIKGPKRRLEKKNILRTEPIDVDGRVESFTKKIKILSPSNTWVSRIDPSEVMVKITISKESTTKEWENLKIMALWDSSSLSDLVFDPDSVNVTLRGRAEIIENISTESIKVFVDCIGLDTTANYELPVIVHLPAGIDVISTVEPKIVKVFFRK